MVRLGHPTRRWGTFVVHRSTPLRVVLFRRAPVIRRTIGTHYTRSRLGMQKDWLVWVFVCWVMVGRPRSRGYDLAESRGHGI